MRAANVWERWKTGAPRTRPSGGSIEEQTNLALLGGSFLGVYQGAPTTKPNCPEPGMFALLVNDSSTLIRQSIRLSRILLCSFTLSSTIAGSASCLSRYRG